MFGNSYYGQAVFEQSNWDFRTLNLDTDVAFGGAKAGPVLNATNPDLRSFRDNGGKLIQYHGWGDAAISPLSSIEYYESVRAFLSRFPDARRANTESPADTTDFYRLFLVWRIAAAASARMISGTAPPRAQMPNTTSFLPWIPGLSAA